MTTVWNGLADGAVRVPEPFDHAISGDVLARDVADAAAAWLDTAAPWSRQRGPFFDQFEVNLSRVPLPSGPVSELTAPTTLDGLRVAVERNFGTPLVPAASVTAHRLVAGQGIGRHNDDPDLATETHRVIVQLGEHACTGGLLLLFERDPDRPPVAGYRSHHNSAICFPLHAGSYHAVTELQGGVRYTVVYSFWSADRPVRPNADIDLRDPGPTSAPAAGAMTPMRSGPATSDVVALLDQLGAGRRQHSGGSLLAHLLHTHDILRRWGCGADTCLAGLFHSIYGTEGYGEPIADRSRDVGAVAALIGDRAERWAAAFAALHPPSLVDAAARRRPELLSFRHAPPCPVDGALLDALVPLALANALEQVEHVPAGDWERSLVGVAGLPVALREELEGAFAAPTWRVLAPPAGPGAPEGVEGGLLITGPVAGGQLEDDLSAAYPEAGCLLTAGRDERRVELVARRPSSLGLDGDAAAVLGRLFGATTDEIAVVHDRTDHGGVDHAWMLDHGWALWAWAHWLRRRPPVDGDPVTIIHVDHHDDLGVPLLDATDDRRVWRCPVDGSRVRLDDPDTVERLLRRRRLGIGSFLTPFLHAVDPAVYVHLHTGHGMEGTSNGKRVLTPGRFLGTVAACPSVERAGDGRTGLVLTGTTDPDVTASVPPAGPVLLDVDLDYFANPYDDALPAPAADIDQSAVVAAIDAFCRKVASAPWAGRIEVLTVALSPGFFPSRLWEAGLGAFDELARALRQA